MNKIHYITIILYLHYINRKTFFFSITQYQKCSILKLVCLKDYKYTRNKKKCIKKFSKKKKFQKKIFFCENEKLNYPRFLGHFYYHGTLNVPSISKKMSIRNWGTFCGTSKSPWSFFSRSKHQCAKPVFIILLIPHWNFRHSNGPELALFLLAIVRSKGIDKGNDECQLDIIDL